MQAARQLDYGTILQSYNQMNNYIEKRCTITTDTGYCITMVYMAEYRSEVSVVTLKSHNPTRYGFTITLRILRHINHHIRQLVQRLSKDM